MIAYQAAFILPAAFALLPPKMDSPAARALLLAIGLQESKFAHRRQLAGGPARSFYQFELGGGVVGVLTHPSTKLTIARVCDTLCYPPAASACYEAMEHNDVLATVFARLLLWTDPRPLPSREDTAGAWKLYERTWRPGKPHPEAWPEHFLRAWALVHPVP